MSVIDKAEDATVLALVVGAGLLLYYLYTKIPSGGDVEDYLTQELEKLKEGLSNAGASVSQWWATLDNPVAPNSTSTIAAQTSASVAQAGGTPAQQAAAAQEVTNFAAWSAPFYWMGAGISADTVVPGTGITIYALRAAGNTDQNITNMLNDAAANPSAYGVQPGDAFDTLTTQLTSDIFPVTA